MPLRILFCLFCVACATCLNAQTQWELTKDKNSIKVYTAKEGASKFKSIKVEAALNGTIQKLAAILRDVNNNKSWVYNTKQSYVLKKNNANDVLYYLETELPWPVDNRDVTIRLRMDVDSIRNTLKATAIAEPNVLPEKKGMVRIKHFNTAWNVRAAGNQLIINYTLNMDPGGSVPASVTNMFISKGPYETFYNLAQLLKK
jgi:hypothetical protein